jgi:hypothetical protein
MVKYTVKWMIDAWVVYENGMPIRPFRDKKDALKFVKDIKTKKIRFM